jgi:hypothetical protein
MFKRANKVTALLVAAASVMSLVPAMASTRLGVKDGHITGDAIAFSDGKYLYEGYRTTDDNTGVYYNNGSDATEKFNDDLRDYEIGTKYGTKYVYTLDNKDQNLIDLTTGKIVDDQTPEDKADSIKSALKSKLKKTDRYSATGVWDSVSLGDSLETETGYNDNTRILSNRFGDNWFLYAAAGDQQAVAPVKGQQNGYATFTIKLPTTEGTTRFEITNSVTPANSIVVTRTSGQSLADFNKAILAAVKANADFRAIFDATTMVISGSTITGQAITIGDKTNDGAFKTFTATYGAALGAVTVDTATASSSDLRLNTLDGVANVASASSSNQNVATATTTSGGVTISRVGLGTATITVKDNSATPKLAYVDVQVTTPDGLKIVKTRAYYSDAEVTAALINISEGVNTATLTDADKVALLANFNAAGIGADVVTLTGSSTTLSVVEAEDAINKFIANDGKLGALNRRLTQAEVTLVLNNALTNKMANVNTSAVLTVTTGQNAQTAVVGISDKHIGYVNEDGKYIDVSDLANIYVYSKVEGKTIKIKEYNKRDADYGITVGLDNIKTLAQDKDYIYALATVSVLEDKVAAPQLETQYFIQKIAKAQGDTKDEAYIPKSVDSYQVDNKSIYDNGDANDAYTSLITGIDGDGLVSQRVNVIDGVLYVTGIRNNDSSNDKVKVVKIVLKKDKIDLVSTISAGKKDGKDVDVYIAKKDGDASQDLRLGSDNTAVAYDVNGNTWAISKGSIYKFTGTDVKEVYTCDRSFTHLDVYDDKNLIAWDKDTDVYTTVGEGTKVTEGEATAVAPVIVTGWVKGTDGTWTFNDATGTKVVSKWQNLGGVWYFLKADGIMATGWFQDGGSTWYYADASGAMKTGWIQDGANWYYLAGSGAMLANTTVDGYVLGASGAWVK